MTGVVLRIIAKVLLPIALIGGTAWAVRALYLSRPEARRERVPPPVPMVSVAELRADDHHVTIEAFGTVIPARRVTLQAQVGGRVVDPPDEVDPHPELVPGAIFAEGSEVIRIERKDYELRVRQREVEVESANASFDLERGQQVVAAKEWALLKDEIEAPQEMEDFALRKPQRRRAQAEVDAAKNQLEIAELDLARTVLRAPFNALVLEESVELGQLVSPQTQVAELVGTDQFWVEVSVPYEMIGRIRFADAAGSPGSTASVFVDPDADPCSPRPARVLRLLGDVSDRGRMARVLMSVEDPLNLAPDADPSARPVLLNSYVRVEIDGGTITDVVEIPRAALRENRRVWIRDGEGRLQIREVNVRWRRRDSVLIDDAFSQGESLIVSRLAVVVPGMELRVGSLPGGESEPPSPTVDEDREKAGRPVDEGISQR